MPDQAARRDTGCLILVARNLLTVLRIRGMAVPDAIRDRILAVIGAKLSGDRQKDTQDLPANSEPCGPGETPSTPAGYC